MLSITSNGMDIPSLTISKDHYCYYHVFPLSLQIPAGGQVLTLPFNQQCYRNLKRLASHPWPHKRPPGPLLHLQHRFHLFRIVP